MARKTTTKAAKIQDALAAEQAAFDAYKAETRSAELSWGDDRVAHQRKAAELWTVYQTRQVEAANAMHG